MGVTRRYWGEGGAVGVLAVAAVLFDRPLLLVGAAGAGGWLVARQYLFVRAVASAAADLSITQSLARDSTRVGDDVRVDLAAESPHPVPVDLEIEATLPVGVETVDGENGLRVTLSVGERSARTAFPVRSAVAGAFRFGRPTATATDGSGRFRAAFPAGPEPRLTVDPPAPTNVHVGANGHAVKAPYGEYDSNGRGPGFDLDTIRAYVPGDEVKRIDWNATARLGHPHVREFEATTERGTAVLLDCRPSMAVGPTGKTPFDYAREVALAVVGHARRRGESVSLFAVGEGGLLDDPTGSAFGRDYAVLERLLRAFDPKRKRRPGTDGVGDVTGTRATDHAAHSPAAARRRSRRLGGDDSAFAGRLRPFFADADPYVERVADDPLFRVARAQFERLRNSVTAVVLTDDTRRGETLQTVKFARRYTDHIVVFLTPRALFEHDTTDIEAAYGRYADFEGFRRELAGLDGVSAFEVGPGDRRNELLAAEERRRRAAMSTSPETSAKTEAGE